MSNVTDRTTILVVGGPENVSQHKIRSAEKRGLRILSEQEFIDLVEGRE